MNYKVLGRTTDEGMVYYIKETLNCEIIDYYKKGNFVIFNLDDGETEHRVKLKIPKSLRGDNNIDIIVFFKKYIETNLPHLIV